MITVFITSGVLVLVQAVAAVILVGMYVKQTAQPTDTDSLMALALLGGMVLLCVAVVLAGVTALLLTRSPLARIVHTIVIGMGVALSITIQTLYIAIPDVLLLAILVLLWLPASKPFFYDTPGVTYYRNTGPGGSRR